MGSRYHATHDSPKIFDDFLAAQLFTAEEHRTFDQQLAGQLKVINPERADHAQPITLRGGPDHRRDRQRVADA